MADEFKKGDKVVWSSHGRDDTPGVVERKITSDTEAGVTVVDLDSDECKALLGGFIAEHPEVWNEDIGV